MKKLISLIVTAVLFMSIIANTAIAAVNINNYIKVTGFDPSVDYSAEMARCLADGSPYAIQIGRIYEAQRNLKIKTLGITKYKPTTFFADNNTAKDIKAAMEASKKPKYTEEDLYWLSRCVNAEMGCSWMPDWVQRDTASVVINNAKWLNKSIKQTIFTPGKYGCVNSGSIYKTPNQKVINNCIYVLDNGTTLPSHIIGQSGYPCGPVYKSYYDSILGTTTYFWYLRRY